MTRKKMLSMCLPIIYSTFFHHLFDFIIYKHTLTSSTIAMFCKAIKMFSETFPSFPFFSYKELSTTRHFARTFLRLVETAGSVSRRPSPSKEALVVVTRLILDRLQVASKSLSLREIFFVHAYRSASKRSNKAIISSFMLTWQCSCLRLLWRCSASSLTLRLNLFDASGSHSLSRAFRTLVASSVKVRPASTSDL